MAYVRKKNGKWQVSVRLKGFPQKSSTWPTEEEAITWGRITEGEMAKGVFVDSADAERITLDELIEFFKSDFAPHHYRQREDGKEAYKSQCKRLSEKLGKYTVAYISNNPKVVAQYRDDRIAEGMKGSTVRKEIFLLSKILGYGEIERGIHLPRGNPTAKVRKPIEGRGRERRLDPKDFDKVIAQCKKSRNPYLVPAVDIATGTTMRQDEMLSLTLNDVNLQAGIIKIRESKTDTEEKRGREIPMSNNVLKVIQKLVDMAAANTPAGTEVNKEARLIPLDRMTLYHVFKAATVRAGVKDFNWHDLRHEALSRLGEEGSLSTAEMMRMSGHRTERMLIQYQHADTHKIREKLKMQDASNEDVTGSILDRAAKDPEFAAKLLSGLASTNKPAHA